MFLPCSQVELTDFNGDGKPDAIFSTGQVALGNGDGTFTLSTPLFPQPANPQVPLSYPLVQMPIYAHSAASLAYLNLTSGANAVFTPQDSSSATLSPALSTGTHVITVHYSGDSTYAAGVSAPVTITVAARGRRLLLCVGFLLFASATILTGCGGSSSNENNTPAGNYTFKVVATSGNSSSGVTYTLTVQ